jgi:hypothetical protein
MLTPFSSEDLGRVFDVRALTKGRTLVLLGTVDVTLRDPSIAVVVEHLGLRHTASITPSSLGHREVFLNKCSCGQSTCAHLAAGSLAALDRYPALRKLVQRNFLDTLATPSAEERQRLVFELSPGEPPHACFVSTFLIGERTGRLEVTTPSRILADRASNQTTRIMARLLGGGDAGRTPGRAERGQLRARSAGTAWQGTLACDGESSHTRRRTGLSGQCTAEPIAEIRHHPR